MNLRHTHVLSAIFAVGIACVPILFTRCTDSASSSSDAGIDVATERRARDAYVAPDVLDVVDAGFVCSPPTSSDGFVHDWPGWTRTTGMDECCPVDSLDDLSQAVPYEWVSCDDAGPGCLRFNAPTADITSTPVIAAEISRGTTGAASQILIARLGLTGGAYEKSIYDFATGQPKASWRFGFSPHCTGTISSRTDISAMLSLSLDAKPFAPTTGVVVATGKVGALRQSPVGAQAGLPWTFLSPSYADGRATFTTSFGGFVTCDMHTPGVPKCLKVNVAGIAPAVLNGYSEFFIESDYVYALSTHGSVGWSEEYVVAPTGEVQLLRGVASTHVGGLASDGKQLTWVEVRGDISLVNPQKIEEVWAAPLTSDPTQLMSTAKKIATLPKACAPNAGVSFNGYYAIWDCGDIFVVRALDGAVIKSPAMPVPYSLYQIVYVTATEVWVMATHNSAIDLFRLTLPTWP